MPKPDLDDTYIDRAMRGAIAQATRKTTPVTPPVRAVNTSDEPLLIGQTLTLFSKPRPVRRAPRESGSPSTTSWRICPSS